MAREIRAEDGSHDIWRKREGRRLDKKEKKKKGKEMKGDLIEKEKKENMKVESTVRARRRDWDRRAVVAKRKGDENTGQEERKIQKMQIKNTENLPERRETGGGVGGEIEDGSEGESGM